MAKRTKTKTPRKSAADFNKRAGTKSKALIDISTPGAETKKIPVKKQRT